MTKSITVISQLIKENHINYLSEEFFFPNVFFFFESIYRYTYQLANFESFYESFFIEIEPL